MKTAFGISGDDTYCLGIEGGDWSLIFIDWQFGYFCGDFGRSFQSALGQFTSFNRCFM